MYVHRWNVEQGWSVLNRKRVNTKGRNSTRNSILQDESVYDLKTLLPRTPPDLCAYLLKYDIAQAEGHQSHRHSVKKSKRSTAFLNLDQNLSKQFF